MVDSMLWIPKPYDEYLNSAIPAILIMVDGYGKRRLEPMGKKQ